MYYCRIIAIIFSVLYYFHCSDHETIEAVDGSIEGSTFVRNADLTISNADHEIIAYDKTDNNGKFKTRIGNGHGNLTLCIKNGYYTDFFTGNTIPLGDHTLCSMALDVQPDTHTIAHITPANHWAYNLSLFEQRVHQQNLGVSFKKSQQYLNQFLNCTNPHDDISNTAYVDLEHIQHATPALTAELRSAILLAGLSFQAKGMSKTLGITPGTQITALNIILAFGDDLRGDGIFNGRDDKDVINILSYPLHQDSIRSGTNSLVQGIRGFMHSTKNTTHLTYDDMRETLLCMGQDSNNPLFRDHVQKKSDEQGPEVYIITPNDHSIVSGIQQLSCMGTDASGIDNIEWYGSINNQPVANSYFNRVKYTTIDDMSSMLLTDIDTGHLPMGTLDLYCLATDNAFNTTKSMLTLTINSQAPMVSITQPSTEELRHIVRIVCTCDHPMSAGCKLLKPAENSNNIKIAFKNRQQIVAEWDTTGESDGYYGITCLGETTGVPDITATKPVLINNIEAGHICGAVFADSPIKNAAINAYTYASVHQKKLLSTTQSNEDGTFCLNMSDSYSGPVLLEAKRIRHTSDMYTSYISSINQKEVLLQEQDLLSLVLNHYEAGSKIDNRSIHYLTTLAESLSTAWRLQNPNADTQQFIQQAHDLFAHHLHAGQHSTDIRTIYPRDMVSDSQFTNETGEDNTRLALFHIGLARMGADIADKTGDTPDAMPSIKILRFLRSDLSNGLLDGFDNNNHQLFFEPSSVALSSETLRFDLAASIQKWLNNSPFQHSGKILANNTTGITAKVYNYHNGFLDHLTTNTIDLFSTQATPKHFDREGPTIKDIQIYADHQDIHPLEKDHHIQKKISLHITAEDDNDVGYTELWFDNKFIPLISRKYISQHAHITMFDIDTSTVTDGFKTIRIVTKDALGNETVHDMQVNIRNEPPKIDIDQKVIWLENGQTAKIAGKSNTPISTVRLITEQNSVSTFNFTDATYEFSLDFKPYNSEIMHPQIEVVDYYNNKSIVNM